MNDTHQSAKPFTATDKPSKGFTDEERATIKQRAQELKVALPALVAAPGAGG
jgi:hypothetical protein